MSELSQQIKHDRMELGLSHQDAALLLGVSRPTYIKWEREPELMPIGQYNKLMQEFARLRNLKEQE